MSNKCAYISLIPNTFNFKAEHNDNIMTVIKCRGLATSSSADDLLQGTVLD